MVFGKDINFSDFRRENPFRFSWASARPSSYPRDLPQGKDWKLLLSGRSPVEFSSLGRWWGNDPNTKSQTEIDIMGEEDKDTALFAECKWTNQKVDLNVLETLVQRSQLFSYKTVHLFLFSKSGFTKGCIDRAAQLSNVSLVTYEDILKAM